MTRVAALLLGLLLSTAVTHLGCDCVASSTAMPGTYELDPEYDSSRSESSRGDLYELAAADYRMTVANDLSHVSESFSRDGHTYVLEYRVVSKTRH